jgi:hypothetical protein
MYYTIKFKYILIGLILIYVVHSGCKKLVEIDPPVTSLTTKSAFNDDYASTSVMTGHYSVLSSENGSFGSLSGISRMAGLSSDELTLWSGSSNLIHIAYYTNNLVEAIGSGAFYWPYFKIYECNTVIENISISTDLSPLVKKQVLGEAKFMRACYFFYLVNFYGDIPMPISTDIKINALLPRTPKDQVYQQIITDLKEAEGLLSAEFLDGGLRPYTSNIERVRPTRWAALALLARAYLYTQDYANAEIAASSIISNSVHFNLVPLNDVFKANSREAVWQLETVLIDRNTGDGVFFNLQAGPTSTRPTYLSNTLLNAFEAGDNRKALGNWVNSITVSGTTYYYAYKYKLAIGSTPKQEYVMMFRLGEQYLIRAEARARLGDINGARDDLFAIRRRAGLADGTLTANDQTSLMTAIMHERQVELFTEWGHRWLDLKRTGMVDAVMSVEAPKKRGATWHSTKGLYPLSYKDIQRDKNLTQNPGY